MEKRICPICGQVFQPKTAAQIYCGRSCAAYGRARQRAKAPKPEPVKRVCDYCKREYVPKNKKQRFCCQKCSSLATAALGREKYEAKLAKLEPKICILCGQEYRPTHRNQKFCSKKCSGARGSSVFIKKADVPKEMTDIRITADVPVFPALRPEVGQVYRAERGREQAGRRFYVIQVRGKPVIVREGECVEV